MTNVLNVVGMFSLKSFFMDSYCCFMTTEDAVKESTAKVGAVEDVEVGFAWFICLT